MVKPIRDGMLKTLTLSVASIALLAAPAAHARPHEGGYFALGLGGSIANGDRGVPLKTDVRVPGLANTPGYQELVRTDFGSGFSFELRFGWLIGPVAPEITLAGHGTFDAKNGAGYPNLGVRFHPMMLVKDLDSPIDAAVFISAGYAIGGYDPKGFDTDGKGWSGWNLAFGFGATYQFSERIRLGFDMRFTKPFYTTFMFDNDNDINLDPVETPSTLILTPTVQLVASF